MRLSPRLLLLLAIPAGIGGYALGVAVISAIPLDDEVEAVLILTVPLFVAGLCMVPFLIPSFDRMARRDLAAHRRATDTAADPAPSDEPSPGPDGGPPS